MSDIASPSKSADCLAAALREKNGGDPMPPVYSLLPLLRRRPNGDPMATQTKKLIFTDFYRYQFIASLLQLVVIAFHCGTLNP